MRINTRTMSNISFQISHLGQKHQKHGLRIFSWFLYNKLIWKNYIYLMGTLFANLYELLMWGSHMVYHEDSIFISYLFDQMWLVGMSLMYISRGKLWEDWKMIRRLAMMEFHLNSISLHLSECCPWCQYSFSYKLKEYWYSWKVLGKLYRVPSCI